MVTVNFRSPRPPFCNADMSANTETLQFLGFFSPLCLLCAALFLDTAADCAIKETLFVSALPNARTLREYQTSGAFAYGLARDASDGRVYWLRGPDPDPEGTADICATATGACNLVASPGIPFQTVHTGSRPTAPLF